MNQNGIKKLAESQFASLGALAAVAGVPSLARLQAEWAREETRRRTELQSLSDLIGCPGEEILSAFHRHPGDWDSFYHLVLQEYQRKIGLTDQKLGSFKLDQTEP